MAPFTAEHIDVAKNPKANTAPIEAVVKDSFIAKQEELQVYTEPISSPLKKYTTDFLFSHLAELLSLEGNWSGPGSVGPSEEAVVRAAFFLQVLAPEKSQLYLKKDDISPTPYGTIVVDWRNFKKNILLSIEIGDSEIGYYLKENGKLVQFSEGASFGVNSHVVKSIVSILKNKF
jgi:hypothetical protein